MNVVFKAEACSKPVHIGRFVIVCTSTMCFFLFSPRYGTKERQPPCRKRGIQNHTVILFPAFTRSLRSP